MLMLRHKLLHSVTWLSAKITLVYLTIGALWIILTDTLLSEWQTAKGVVFILMTTAILFLASLRHFKSLNESKRQLHQSYDLTLWGWVHALEMRDNETENHTLRVTELTLHVAWHMGIHDEQELVHIKRGALLHDIGKMAVPDHILNKADSLTDDEWVIMRRHPQYAFEWLKQIPYLQPALHIPYFHHEKWDGTGYPVGLNGRQIPLSARIFAIVDTYDALTSDRSYRSAWSCEKAIEYIKSQAGSHFDPEVVEVFLNALNYDLEFKLDPETIAIQRKREE